MFHYVFVFESGGSDRSYLVKAVTRSEAIKELVAYRRMVETVEAIEHEIEEGNITVLMPFVVPNRIQA